MDNIFEYNNNNNVEELPQEEDLPNGKLAIQSAEQIDTQEQAVQNNTKSENGHVAEYFDTPISGESLSMERECPTYKTGELFWGRVYTYCYWPCIVCSDPESKRIVTEYIFQGAGNQLYSVHVRFFADNGRSYWVKGDNLLPFTNLEDYYQLIEETKQKYSGRLRAFLPSRRNRSIWQKAVEDANLIATLPLEERLGKFLQISIIDKTREKHPPSPRRLSTNYSLLESLNDTNKKSTQSKRKRSISQSSSLDSFNKNQTNKRRRFKYNHTANNISQTENISILENHTPYTPLDESNIRGLSENSPDHFQAEFHTLFTYIKDFVMDQSYNENLESNIHEIVREIWELRELNRRQSRQNSYSTNSEFELNGSILSTNRNSSKRLSGRVRNAKMKAIMSTPSSSSNMDENVENMTILPLHNSTSEGNGKKIVKPIMDVINDIFSLDIKYLFKGLNRDTVCSYCFQAGKNLKKCSQCLQTWMHLECLHSNAATTTQGRKYRRKHSKRLINENESVDEKAVDDVADNFLICKECESGRRTCSVCKHEEESSNTNDDPLISCSIAQCNAVYHLRCCKYWPQAKVLMTKDRIDSFRCPSHVCHTCASDDPKSNFEQLASNKITKCMKCPATYHSHSTCIPAGSQILTMACIICPRHSILKRDTNINVNWCFICVGGGKLVCCENCPNAVHEQCLKLPLDASDGYICEECESGRMPLYGEIVWAKYNSFRWWPSIILPPPEVPQNVARLSHAPSEFVVRFLGTHNHGWISRRRVYLYVEGDANAIQKRKSATDVKYNTGVNEAKEIYEIIKNKKLELHATSKIRIRPQPYIKIKSNRAVAPVKLHSNMEVNKCECSPYDDDPCGPNSRCLNRVLYHECNPNICPAGELCQNQMFESRQSPRLDTIYIQKRGFGLVTLESISNGCFIIEYVGEVINDEEFRNRMSRKFRNRDENFYFLSVEKDYIIDADRKGNLARFINHSCDPNCQTQKWSVNSINRVGIFAIQDIPAGTELTFNYHWDDLFGNEKKTCYCGTKNCTGFIGGKIKKLQ